MPVYLARLLRTGRYAELGILDDNFCESLVRKVMNNPLENISPREDQAFLRLVSTPLLHEQFVLGQCNPDRRAPRPMVTVARVEVGQAPRERTQ